PEPKAAGWLEWPAAALHGATTTQAAWASRGWTSGVAGGVSAALQHHDDDTSRGPRILRLAGVAAGGSIALRQHDDDRTMTQAALALHPCVFHSLVPLLWI
ncbi:Os11g0666000, partial [Oryza sativa Japonica Group]